MINQNLLLTGDDGYNLTNSLRFRSSAQSYLSRTFGAPTDNEKWTYSVWIKRGSLAANRTIMSSNVDGAEYWDMRFNTSDQILIQNRVGSSNLLLANTTAVYRDPSAWYHIVFVFDSNNATAANRNLLYVNGVNVTLSANSGSSDASAWNVNSVQHNIGVSRTLNPSGGIWAEYDGYKAEVNFIDGQALTPSSFGETSTTTGVWIPKKFVGTYGTNGFYLPFTDNSALTTSSNVGLGKDFSGNANYFATNNISITAGTTYDSMTDVPTLTSATAANYCVLNPLTTTAGTYSNANLRYLGASAWRRTNSTLAVSTGKWYWEVSIANAPFTPRGSTTAYNTFGFGLSTVFNSTTSASTVTDAVILADNAYFKNFSGAWTDSGLTFVTSDTLAVAVDLDVNTFTFYRNNSQVTTGTIGGTVGRELTPIILSYNGDYGIFDCNFGQRPFTYTPPSGFVALNTFNLPTPTIGATASSQANDNFNAVTYTGTSGTQSVTGVGFQPDFVWIKNRTSTLSHVLQDAVRGTTAYLVSNATTAENTNTASNWFRSFNSDGFTVATLTDPGSVSTNEWNNTGYNYVSWNWKASGTTSNITVGQYSTSPNVPSIASTVSASTTAGFSIVTYTGNNTSGATVGHGLGATPSLIMVKVRNAVARWVVYQKDVTTANNQFLELNSFTGVDTSGTNFWTISSINSTTFGLGTNSDTNGSALNFVAYCFAPIAGYSAFGSYTGNGSTDGPFVFTGFRPRFVLLKSSSAATDWYIYDTARDTYNVATLELNPNLAAAEQNGTYGSMDILSNGFKLRFATGEVNASGATYIYYAVAENPFKYANAR